MRVQEFPIPGSIQDRTGHPFGGNLANMRPAFYGDRSMIPSNVEILRLGL